MIEIDRIYNEDCLIGMRDIPDATVDAIICDLPYGTTACAWDNIIPFEPMWAEFRRVTKPNAAIVLFGSEPFSSALRMSNIKEYRYDWKWQKAQGSGGLKANYQPLRDYEDICVFSQRPAVYCPNPMSFHPQFEKGKPYTIKRPGSFNKKMHSNKGGTFVNDGKRFPKSIIYFDFKGEKTYHPTQKPVDLLRYLILTYTNSGGVVLDATIGSGTTAVAAIREKRHFIGFELNKEYFDIAQRRIADELRQPSLF